jgi:hypothetical protein
MPNSTTAGTEGYASWFQADYSVLMKVK